jgi:hypothetical protein|nr:MAG TPA: hypothetical protein [Caudoviricetes sp.]DAR72101.1 MAG TPA: hypothetical protein [Caudoviricetes sp.]
MKKYTIAFLIIIITIFSCNFSYAKIIRKEDVSPEAWNHLMDDNNRIQAERTERAKEEQKEANEKFNMLAENKELEEKNNNQQSIIITLSIIVAVIILCLIINIIRKNFKITIEKKK